MDGDTYLHVPWGSSDFSTSDDFGNQCPTIRNVKSFKFSVRSSDGLLIFETGSIAVENNIFDATSVGEHLYSNGKDAWVTTNIVEGHRARFASGATCSWGGSGQRTTLCIGNGQTFQSVLGGINGDSYGNGNGPCMCDTAELCGLCESKNIIEIYHLGKFNIFNLVEL